MSDCDTYSTQWSRIMVMIYGTAMHGNSSGVHLDVTGVWAYIEARG